MFKKSLYVDIQTLQKDWNKKNNLSILISLSYILIITRSKKETLMRL
jgi:hypothetical protein